MRVMVHETRRVSDGALINRYARSDMGGWKTEQDAFKKWRADGSSEVRPGVFDRSCAFFKKNGFQNLVFFEDAQ